MKMLIHSLSEEKKEQAQKYVRFCIRGKLGKTVPIILDELKNIFTVKK